jgi:antitoxin MazE
MSVNHFAIRIGKECRLPAARLPLSPPRFFMDKFSRIIKSKIVRIGNSQGVRIPHFLLQQLHLANEVEMSIQDDQLVIRAARKPRQDWEARFSRLLPAESLPSGEEALPQLTDWDGTEWTW